MQALHELAADVENVFRVSCEFTCNDSILIRNNAVATHVYFIAREAVNNAVKHASPQHVSISLKEDTDGRVVLVVLDDGTGLPEDHNEGTGVGLRIMAYRADMIGGELKIKPGDVSGTLLWCSFMNVDGDN